MTDARAELIRELRRLAAAHGLEPGVRTLTAGDLSFTPKPVVHTSHPTFGYLIVTANRRVVWAPEFLEFPPWAAGVDLMFAEAAGWERPILFARVAGGHASTLEVARQALVHGVRRVVFAHIGRPTIAAIDAGRVPPFARYGDGRCVFTVDE
ncbi:MAG: MBL fold metallo-hydrolase [Mycobacterium leprae]